MHYDVHIFKQIQLNTCSQKYQSGMKAMVTRSILQKDAVSAVTVNNRSTKITPEDMSIISVK